MKNVKCFFVIGLVVSILLPFSSVFAQTPAKKSLPSVPITYSGDTDETIIRRAQWIEGARKEGTLNLLGILLPAWSAKLIPEFNKIYPFIKMNSWSGKGEEVATKLEAEAIGGRSTVDVTLGGEPYNYPRWRKMGIMEKFTDIIPGIKSKDKRMYGKYGDWAQPGNNGVTPHYNTGRVSAAEAPKSWEDLLDPKWKGQIGITTDMKVWTTLALEEGGWGIEKTEAFLRNLKQQQMIWASSHNAAHALLTAGEFKIVGENYLFFAFQAQDQGAPVAWCRVTPVPVTGPSLILQKKASNPNAARLFVEWLFSPQGLMTYEKITNYGAASPGAGTRLSKALEGLPLVYRSEEGEQKVIETGLDKRFAKIVGAISE